MQSAEDPQPAPPPGDAELRKRIEKLAEYVARSGSGFEDKVRQKEKENPMWAFLREPGDAAAYYKWILHMKRMQQPASSSTSKALDPAETEKRAYIESLKQQREAKRQQQQQGRERPRKRRGEHVNGEKSVRKRQRVEEQHYVFVCPNGERVVVQDIFDEKRPSSVVGHDLDDSNWAP